MTMTDDDCDWDDIDLIDHTGEPNGGDDED